MFEHFPKKKKIRGAVNKLKVYESRIFFPSLSCNSIVICILLFSSLPTKLHLLLLSLQFSHFLLSLVLYIICTIWKRILNLCLQWTVPRKIAPITLSDQTHTRTSESISFLTGLSPFKIPLISHFNSISALFNFP